MVLLFVAILYGVLYYVYLGFASNPHHEPNVRTSSVALAYLTVGLIVLRMLGDIDRQDIYGAMLLGAFGAVELRIRTRKRT